MKKLYFGSNLKMYKGISATREYLQKLVENTKDISRDDIELFIIPSYTTLQTATDCCDRDFVRLGAQNMCWEDQGQFTGEISPCMLAEMGLDLVMIGHSERRHVFGESDVEENKKVKAALSHGFKTLLCIGETAEQKEYGISAETLRSQLKIGFYGVSPEECKNIWVAYERYGLSVSMEHLHPQITQKPCIKRSRLHCMKSLVKKQKRYLSCTVEVSIREMQNL